MRPGIGDRPQHAVGLYRVSTAEHGQSGLGLEAQQTAVRAFAAAQGWTLVGEYADIASGKDDRRPGFLAALIRCRQLGATLAAARLDRITRRAHTLAAAGGGLSDPGGRHAGCGRSDDADLRRDATVLRGSDCERVKARCYDVVTQCAHIPRVRAPASD